MIPSQKYVDMQYEIEENKRYDAALASNKAQVDAATSAAMVAMLTNEVKPAPEGINENRWKAMVNSILVNCGV